MSDTGEPDFSPGDVTPQTVQAAGITPVITISPDDPTFQAPSIMGGVDYSGNDLPVQGQGGLTNIAGKIWNLPNTALGLAYGGAGYLAGLANYELGGQEQAPGIQLGNNAIQFTNNPFGGVSAITIGNAEVFGNRALMGSDGQPIGAPHEEQHTYQGEQLGPLYLPSNLLGGITAEVLGGDWHAPQNWNETGPQQNPPVPWPQGDQK
jgi:hypothetical protein